jgi:hypothetical protein
MQINLRSIDRFVPKPKCDDRRIDSRLQELHGSTVWRSTCGETRFCFSDGQCSHAIATYLPNENWMALALRRPPIPQRRRLRRVSAWIRTAGHRGTRQRQNVPPSGPS